MRAMALWRKWKDVEPYSRSDFTRSDLDMILCLSKIQQQSETAQNNGATLPNGRVSLYTLTPHVHDALSLALHWTASYTMHHVSFVT